VSYQLLTAKKEAVYGTAVANAAVDSIWALDVSFKSLGQRVVLAPAKPSLAADAGVITGEHSELTFDVLLAGSGAAGVAPKWSKLITAAGYGEDVEAGASVAYTILNDPDLSDSLTMQWSDMGRLHQMVGARGKVGLKATAGQPPRLSFLFRGLLVPVAARAPVGSVDANFADWEETRPIAQGRTTFSLGGVPMVLRVLSVDAADNVKFVDLPNLKGVFLRGDRALSGSFKANVPPIGTYSPEAKWISGAKDVFAFTHNTAPGEIVTVNGRVQLDAPTWSREDDFDVFSSQAFLVGSDPASNDDFSILLT
jgi:hypothetical protein